MNASTSDAPLPGMVGVHPRMREVYRVARRLARTPHPVVIVGETGTGKELVARAIHALGRNPAGPFVDMNCGAVPETLAESELFGCERGAFTGADRRRPGLLEQADGGTLLLDELCSMPPDLQVKLLRAIELQEFRRVGGRDLVRVRFRAIATVSLPVETLIRGGRLRRDLATRLTVAEICLAPLRERRSDIPLLTRYVLNELAEDNRPDIAPEAHDALMRRSWPGNVRELRTAVLRASILADGTMLTSADFAEPAKPANLMELDASALESVLAHHRWCVTEAAGVFQVSRETLYRRMRALGISRPNTSPRSVSHLTLHTVSSDTLRAVGHPLSATSTTP